MSDNFQTSCLSHSGSRLLPFLWFCLLAGLSACSWTKDDRGDCPSGFRIRLQPALHAQIQPGSGIGIITDEIDTLSLYVFDAQGQFVCLHTENRQSLTENGSIITLPLEYKDGDVYELVFWAGGDNRHYRIPHRAVRPVTSWSSGWNVTGTDVRMTNWDTCGMGMSG